MRLAIAMLWHEGNSFSPVPTDLDWFRAGGWAIGDEAREMYAGTASEIGGALDYVDAHPECDAQFLRLAWRPQTRCRTRSIRPFATKSSPGLPAARGTRSISHCAGALVTDLDPLADLHFLERVRVCIGPDVKLGISFDLHANIDPRIAGLVDFATDWHPFACRPAPDRPARAGSSCAVRERGTVSRSGTWPSSTPSCPASTCAQRRDRWPNWKRSPAHARPAA